MPPDYHELLYQKYQNCKQLGNSVSEFTNEFYRLQSYLDLIEPEAYNISMYMMGLRWAIRERLSSQSFYYLSDLVSATKGIEQLMEREKIMKGRPQTLQHTTIEDVSYPVVSATQKCSSTLCNSKENVSTLSSKVSSNEREYGHTIASKRIVVDFVNVIKDEDHVVRQQEEEPQKHSAVSTDCTTVSNICIHSVDDKVDEDLFSARLVKKLGLKTECPARHYRINWIHQDESKCQEIERCTIKFHVGRMYFDEEFNDVVNTTTCHLPSRREWKADHDGYLLDNTPQVKGERNMVLVNGDEHCSILTAKEGGIFTARKMELNDPISYIENSNHAHQSLNEFLGRTHFKENINSCALLVFLVPEMYQGRKICNENQTMSITCKFRISTRHLDYMLGILCRSWMQFYNIFMRRYHQHNTT